MSGPVIGFLTGPVGIGKTTIAERLVGLCRRQGVRCGGLLAPPIKNSCGQKAGIWGVDISSGERRILARTDRDLGGAAVGPYSFDAGALAWAVSVIEQAMGSCDLLIVDEIGKLELWQGQGLAPLLPRLAAGEAERVLILVRASLLEELQARFPATSQAVFQATEGNRGQLPGQILAMLTRWTTPEAQAQQPERSGGKLL